MAEANGKPKVTYKTLFGILMTGFTILIGLLFTITTTGVKEIRTQGKDTMAKIDVVKEKKADKTELKELKKDLKEDIKETKEDIKEIKEDIKDVTRALIEQGKILIRIEETVKK